MIDALHFLAALLFAIAALLSFRFHLQCREVTRVWLLLALSFGFFAASCMARAIDLPVSFRIENTAFLIGAALWVSVMAMHPKTEQLCQDSVAGNLKKRDGKRYRQLKEYADVSQRM